MNTTAFREALMNSVSFTALVKTMRMTKTDLDVHAWLCRELVKARQKQSEKEAA